MYIIHIIYTFLLRTGIQSQQNMTDETQRRNKWYWYSVTLLFFV